MATTNPPIPKSLDDQPTLDHLRHIKETIVDKATAPVTPEPIISVEQLEAACALILNAMSGVDTVWRERILAVREEKGYDNTRILFFLAGKTLNIGNHLENFSHHFFDSEAAANPMLLGKAKCELETCGKVFVPKKPMQQFCSNECGEVVERRRIEETKRKVEIDSRRKRIMKGPDGNVAFSVGGEPEGNPSPPAGSITRRSVA